MQVFEIILLSLSLSVDSLLVSMGGSVSLGRKRFSRVLYITLFFAVVQAGLLGFGWIAGYAVAHLIYKIANVTGFLILAYLGGAAVWSALRGKEEGHGLNLNGVWPLVVASVATSIDAFAVGASLAMSDEMPSGDIFMLCASVGAVTMIASFCGIRFGSMIGQKFGCQAKLAGGVVLILIGVKLLF